MGRPPVHDVVTVLSEQQRKLNSLEDRLGRLQGVYPSQDPADELDSGRAAAQAFLQNVACRIDALDMQLQKIPQHASTSEAIVFRGGRKRNDKSMTLRTSSVDGLSRRRRHSTPLGAALSAGLSAVSSDVESPVYPIPIADIVAAETTVARARQGSKRSSHRLHSAERLHVHLWAPSQLVSPRVSKEASPAARKHHLEGQGEQSCGDVDSEVSLLASTGDGPKSQAPRLRDVNHWNWNGVCTSASTPSVLNETEAPGGMGTQRETGGAPAGGPRVNMDGRVCLSLQEQQELWRKRCVGAGPCSGAGDISAKTPIEPASWTTASTVLRTAPEQASRSQSLASEFEPLRTGGGANSLAARELPAGPWPSCGGVPALPEPVGHLAPVPMESPRYTGGSWCAPPREQDELRRHGGPVGNGHAEGGGPGSLGCGRENHSYRSFPSRTPGVQFSSAAGVPPMRPAPEKGLALDKSRQWGLLTSSSDRTPPGAPALVDHSPRNTEYWPRKTGSHMDPDSTYAGSEADHPYVSFGSACPRTLADPLGRARAGRGFPVFDHPDAEVFAQFGRKTPQPRDVAVPYAPLCASGVSGAGTLEGRGNFEEDACASQCWGPQPMSVARVERGPHPGNFRSFSESQSWRPGLSDVFGHREMLEGHCGNVASQGMRETWGSDLCDRAAPASFWDGSTHVFRERDTPRGVGFASAGQDQCFVRPQPGSDMSWAK
uniref:Uncharacterized protein n=1 Tax=Noctiluca scintillans TaxID=2966 RepID=A0A7S1AL48_NOCSC